jgi:hypothetical protein
LRTAEVVCLIARRELRNLTMRLGLQDRWNTPVLQANVGRGTTADETRELFRRDFRHPAI